MNNNKMDDLYIIMYCLWVASVCPYKITHKLSVSQLSVFYRILKVVERTAVQYNKFCTNKTKSRIKEFTKLERQGG